MNNTILIVEDEVLISIDLANLLELAGYAVLGPAHSGAEAIRLALDASPDLIIMDVQLAGDMDGISAAQAITTKSDIPVIYLTAHSDGSTVERAKVTAPYGFLLKPFSERELLIAV
ncbi:MAG: response regulator, partial [Pseudomonadota bacterium]